MEKRKIRTRTAPATTANITAAVIGVIDTSGGFAYPTKTVGVYDPVNKIFRQLSKRERGKADVTGVIRGRAIAVEIKNKATRDKMRPEQIEFRDRFVGAGGIYMICGVLSDWKEAFFNLIKTL